MPTKAAAIRPAPSLRISLTNPYAARAANAEKSGAVNTQTCIQRRV